MDLNAIKAAKTRIAPFVRETPLERNSTLSSRLGAEVYVKYELFQRTGSFKARGAFNKLLQLDEGQRARGVVAVSGGNHAQAVAYASKTLDIDAFVIMPESTPRNYVEATMGYGASIVLKPSIKEAFEEAAALERAGRTFLHPFDDPDVMAGQGTVGIEIMELLPETTDIIVSIGGGGLAGGVSTAVKSMNERVRIWGVETEGADAMSLALTAGYPVELPEITSIAKTLGAPAVSARTLRIAQELLESVTVVSDREAVDALQFIAERLKVLTEPAASCTLAAADRLRITFDRNSRVVLILCGGNVGLDNVCQYIGSVLGESK